MAISYLNNDMHLHVNSVICASYDSILYLDENGILKIIDDGTGLLDDYQIATSGGNTISEFKDIHNCKEICSIGEANLLLLDDGTVVYHYLVDAKQDIQAYIPQHILNKLINIEWIYCKYSTFTLLDSSNVLHCIRFDGLTCLYTQYPNSITCKLTYNSVVVLDTNYKLTIYFNNTNLKQITLPNTYRLFTCMGEWLLCITHANFLEVYCINNSEYKIKYKHSNILDLETVGFETVYMLNEDCILSILNCNTKTKTVEKLVSISKSINHYTYNSLNSNKSLIKFLKIDDSIAFKTKETILYSDAMFSYISLDSKESFTDLDPNCINDIYSINEYLIVKLRTCEYRTYIHLSYKDDSIACSSFANKIKDIRLLSQPPGSYI